MNEKLFTQRLKDAIYESRLSQSEICEKTKIPKSAMSQYVNGKSFPKTDRAYLIADVLKVDAAWLMGFDVPKMPTDKLSLDLPHITKEEEGRLSISAIAQYEAIFHNNELDKTPLYKLRVMEQLEKIIATLSLTDLDRLSSFIDYRKSVRRNELAHGVSLEQVSIKEDNRSASG